ncbi:MAG: phospholipase D-like domain-containing protein [Luteolibacter sp.]
MIELIDGGWSSHFTARAKERHATLRVVCPFIKQRAVKRLLDSGHRPGIQIITRFNLTDFSSGVSDVGALKWMIKQGAQIRGVKGLHSKMYLFGDRHSMVTSANLTEAALFRNQEYGFVSQDKNVAKDCHSYFDRLWGAAGADLTLDQLAKWQNTLRAGVAGGAKPPPSPSLPDEGVTLSLLTPPSSVIGSTSIPLPPLFAEAEQAFVKFLGTSEDRWPTTSKVIEVIEATDCHRICAYPKRKRPNIVQTGAIMFIARLLIDGDIMVFGRALAIRHRPGTDEATADDIAHLGWMETWSNFVRIHHAEFVDGTLESGIRLSELMADLGTNSFASTQLRATNGETNIDPRRAYGQQAAVRLSRKGLDWLNARLEEAFNVNGKLGSEVLRGLRWPEVIN